MIGAESDEVLYPSGVEPAPWTPDEDATASINYTSGTTARPKGVQLTHRNIWINATTFGWHMGVDDRDVYLHTLPQFHCNGWGMPYAVTGMGGRHVVLRKVDGAEILRRVERHGVTLLCGAPAVLGMILDAAASWDGPVPGKGTVRMVVAGAPPPSRTIERTEVELGWEFVQIYGLTETAPFLTMNRARAEYDDLNPADRARRLVRTGAPAIGVQLDVDGEGEVLARSNVVMEGYWNQPEETARAIVDGWFHTGDGGAVDDESYLMISDRKKDVIISGGENVSSIEVEDALFQHPAVAEVAVIGIPDEQVGRAGHGARGAGARRRGHVRRAGGVLPGAPGRLQAARSASSSGTSWPARPRASSRSSSSASPSGPARTARSTDRPADAGQSWAQPRSTMDRPPPTRRRAVIDGRYRSTSAARGRWYQCCSSQRWRRTSRRPAPISAAAIPSP